MAECVSTPADHVFAAAAARDGMDLRRNAAPHDRRVGALMRISECRGPSCIEHGAFATADAPDYPVIRVLPVSLVPHWRLRSASLVPLWRLFSVALVPLSCRFSVSLVALSEHPSQAQNT